jgi:CBS domain-containing protein
MLTVAELMQRDVITVDPDLSLRQLITLFDRKHISGAPVARGRHPIGVVSASDVLSFLAATPGVPVGREGFVEQGEARPPDDWEEGEVPADYFTELWDDAGADLSERFLETDSPEWDLLAEHTVDEVMTRAVATIPPGTEVHEAARYLLKRGLHRIIVVDAGGIQGILTTTDLVRAVAEGRLK